MSLLTNYNSIIKHLYDDTFSRWSTPLFGVDGREKRKNQLNTSKSISQNMTTVSFDINEDTNQYEISAEVPGLSKKDLNINIEDSILEISGEKEFKEEKKKKNYHLVERSYGSFSRSFMLPNTIDESKIYAGVEDGVLAIILPKKKDIPPKKLAKKIVKIS